MLPQEFSCRQKGGRKGTGAGGFGKLCLSCLDVWIVDDSCAML